MAQRHIGQELRIIHNLTKRLIDNSSIKKQIDNVTGTNGWIIAYLTMHSGQDVFQRDLEREFGITRSTASKVINLMVEKGLIERQPVPHDARLKKLVLTPRSKTLSELFIKDQALIEERLTQGFSEEELDILQSYLKRLHTNLTR